MNRIKELRNELRMTQEELGSLANADKGTVSRWEAERRQFDTATIHKLCDLFGCTSDYLLCRSSFRHPFITEDQAAMLRAYDKASDRDKSLIDQILAPYIDSSETKKDASSIGTSKETDQNNMAAELAAGKELA